MGMPIAPLRAQPPRIMHIAYVTETWPPELNGVSLTVERTVRYLRARGHLVEADPAAPARRSAARCERRAAHRRLRHPDVSRPALRPGASAHARAPLPAERPDLVHLATPGPLPWAALLAARSLGIVTTSDFRTNFHQYSRHYGLGMISGSVLGLLRRFPQPDAAHLRADAGGATRARCPGLP
jgi:glycosyltransferase involved in cell wall biosynthesis